MNRRDAVQYISLLLGGTLVGGTAFLTGCSNNDAKAGEGMNFTPEEIAYLNEVADTILPTTSTPGAKAANVGQFMTVMVKDCYTERDQKVFREGMEKLNEQAENRFKNSFMQLTPQQRTQLLVELDKEQKDFQGKKKPEDASHYFRMMKELTMLGYFTSEIGSKQARRYVPVPGRYEGCIPYKKGDKAWA